MNSGTNVGKVLVKLCNDSVADCRLLASGHLEPPERKDHELGGIVVRVQSSEDFECVRHCDSVWVQIGVCGQLSRPQAESNWFQKESGGLKAHIFVHIENWVEVWFAIFLRLSYRGSRLDQSDCMWGEFLELYKPSREFNPIYEGAQAQGSGEQREHRVSLFEQVASVELDRVAKCEQPRYGAILQRDPAPPHQKCPVPGDLKTLWHALERGSMEPLRFTGQQDERLPNKCWLGLW
jgi:hypothetical protein